MINDPVLCSPVKRLFPKVEIIDPPLSIQAPLRTHWCGWRHDLARKHEAAKSNTWMLWLHIVVSRETALMPPIGVGELPGFCGERPICRCRSLCSPIYPTGKVRGIAARVVFCHALCLYVATRRMTNPNRSPTGCRFCIQIPGKCINTSDINLL